jgi:hypothetical protein
MWLTVHLVLLNSILSDLLQPVLLVTLVELRTGNGNPCCVGGRDTEGVDTDAGKLIDCGGIEERSITRLKNGAAVLAKFLAECPLVRGVGTANGVPPDGVVCLLLGEPSSEVGTVSLKCPPVDKIPVRDAFGPRDIVMVSIRLRLNLLNGERTLLVVLQNLSAEETVSVELEVEVLHDTLESLGHVSEKISDGTRCGCRSSVCASCQCSGGNECGKTHYESSTVELLERLYRVGMTECGLLDDQSGKRQAQDTYAFPAVDTLTRGPGVWNAILGENCSCGFIGSLTRSVLVR